MPMATDSTEMPGEPERSGAELTQRQASEEEVAALLRSPATGGIVEYPLSDALGQVSEQGVRGHAGMLLLNAFVRHGEGKLFQLRGERDEELRRLNQCQESLHECQSTNAVLNERFLSFSRISLLQSVFITIGSLVLGVSVPIAIEKQAGAP